MDWLELLKNRARAGAGGAQRLVFSQGEDARVIAAAARIAASGMAKPTLVGRPREIEVAAKRAGVSLNGVAVADPASSPQLENCAQIYFERRRARGISLEEARATARQPVHFAHLLVAARHADGSVVGGARSIAETARTAEQIIGLAPQRKFLSSFSLVLRPAGSAVLCADSGLNPNPGAEELAEIALATAESARVLLETQPRVALLSYSPKGSVGYTRVEKVREALRIVKARAPDLVAEGELRGDAALAPEVAAQQAPGSPVAGRANVLIFPDVDWDNLAYALDHQWAGAKSLGPLLQGLAGAANDLSRGYTVEEIMNVAAITALQAIAASESRHPTP